MAGKESFRILLVDDDKDLLHLLKYIFEKEGFLVKTVSRSNKAISAAIKFQPDLIVLDMMMPEVNGIELCREIRTHNCFKSTYIFFLTAHSERCYKEAALDIGADDFIEKLCGIRALTNKVIAVLKNKFIIKKSIPALFAEDLVVNQRSEHVYFRNQEIVLSESEFEILFFLMQNPNKVISLKNLIKIIWGSEMYVLGSSVQKHIGNLQRKVGEKRIETLNNDQFRFNLTIR